MHRFRTDGRPAGSAGRRLVCISPHREPSPADRQFKPLPNPCARRDSCQFERILVSKRFGHLAAEPRSDHHARNQPENGHETALWHGMRPPKGRLARSRRQKPRSPLPVDCIRLASAPSSAPTRARTRFAGHFRTISPHDLTEPTADSPKVDTKEWARTNNERGQDDQAPPHPNAEGPGSYSLPPLSASFAASPSTSPKPSLKLLGTTTVPPVSRTLSYSRCMARRRSAASFSA